MSVPCILGNLKNVSIGLNERIDTPDNSSDLILEYHSKPKFLLINLSIY